VRGHLWALSLLAACDVPGGAPSVGHSSAALQISPEIELSSGRPNGVLDSSLPGSERIAIALNGTGLAAWEDLRSETGYENYFTRFDAQGTPLDPDGLTFPSARLRGVSIASDGTDYLAFLASGGPLNVARFSAQGTFVDPAPLRFGTSGFAAHAAHTQGLYLVAWADCRNVTPAQCNATSLDAGIDVYGFRITSSGADIDDAGFAISTAGNAQMPTAVAASPSMWLVAWNDQRSGDNDIYAARITASTVVDPGGLALATGPGDQFGAALAFEGTSWFAAWVDNEAGGQVWQAFLSTSGVIQTTGAVNGPNGGVPSVSVACVPGTCLAAWPEGGRLWGRRFSSLGLALDSAPVPLSDTVIANFGVALGATTSEFVGVATTESGPRELRVSPATGWDGGTIWLQAPTTFSWTPLVVATSGGYVTAWTEGTHATADDIYAMRFDSYGRQLDVQPLALANTPAEETDVALATDGTNTLALWAAEQTPGQLDFELEGRLMPPSGVSGPPVHVAAAASGPQVAFNNGQYLTVFLDPSGSPLYAARIAANGTVLDPTGFVLNSSTNVTLFRLVASGGGFLMLLGLSATGGSNNVAMHLVRLSLDGMVLDDRVLLTEPQVVSWDQASAGPLGPHAFIWRTQRTGAVHNVAWLFDADGGDVADDVNLGPTSVGASLAWDRDRLRGVNTVQALGVFELAVLDVFTDGGVASYGDIGSNPPGDALYPKVAMGPGSVGMLVEQRFVKPRERAFARLIAFGDAGLPVPPGVDSGFADGGTFDGGAPDSGSADGGFHGQAASLRVGCGCDASSFALLPALLFVLRLRRSIRPRNG
jgi:hypothetical protein